MTDNAKQQELIRGPIGVELKIYRRMYETMGPRASAAHEMAVSDYPRIDWKAVDRAYAMYGDADETF